ncbi:Aspartic-type endopeptidase [Pleurostoma richardsiae]|uniref:Aspartic-type endopeptidase n=1 Tax=Pleurostoma richardsiae TaxID=41990 RepID=A0AA38RT10_9PEZI|nr:Aspartic-type endopeptidase [Pleurostoma richardsiae]
MLRIIALVHLTLWATTVRAFFPYFPQYLCSDDDICVKGEKRDTAGLRRASPKNLGGPLTFSLSQRTRGENAPSSVRVAREADRLRRKHASSRLSNERELGRRGNTYSIDSAVEPTMANSEGIDQDGTDFSYFIEAGFGSSEKSLYMLVDTGAGTTWVMGSNCKSSACTMHNSYGSGDSKTYQTTTDSFSIAYGSGTVGGALAEDSITVSTMKTTMSFGVANTTSDEFTHFPFDGILGLSMSKGATDNFMETVKGDKLLKSNIFSVSLSRSSDGTNTGEITFGATNPDKFTGDIGYTSVSSSAGGDWAISMGDVAFDGKKAGLPDRLAYIDTGTSYVFGPSDDVVAIHKNIPGASSSDDGQTFTVPCSTKLPIVITFSGVDYSVSPKDWVSSPSSSGVCTSNIYGHEVVQGAWLLGDLFLKNVYTVFDVDQGRIGFASKPAVTTTTTSTSSASAATSSSSSGTQSTLATLITPSPVASGASLSSQSTSSFLGLSGHETSATSGTAVAETPAPSASATQTSPGEQLEGNKYASIMCVVVAIAFMA